MGGLALGNWLLGRTVDRVSRRLAMYGVLELGVAAWCLLFPLIASGLSRLYLALASPDVESGRNLLLKVVLSVLALLPPATLMGGTLPALTRHFAYRLEQVGRTVAILYFVNSAGAAAGCLIAGFALIATLGLDRTMVLTALVNAALGAVCVWLGRASSVEASPSQPEQNSTADTSYTTGQQLAVLALIFASGCISMLYELVWIRLIALVMGSSTYSFSTMLFTFIAGISLGALLVSLFSSRITDPLRLFAWTELGVCVCLAVMIPFYERLPYWFNVLAAGLKREPGMFPAYLSLKVAVSTGLMIVPTVLIGATLPLAARVVTTRVELLGRSVGGAFSVNTLGNVVGSVLSGFVLIPAFGLQWCMETGILASGLVGAAALAAWARPNRRVLYAAVAAVAAVGLLIVLKTVSPRWSTMVLNSGVYRVREAAAGSYAEFRARVEQETVLFHHDGPDMSVAVGHGPKGADYLWMNSNGKTEASTDTDMGTQVLVAHIPLILKPDAREVFVVGLGSGITVGAALHHPIERCDVAEISESVVRASRHFDQVSGSPLDDPRTHLAVSDAKEFLLLQDRRYDVIISEPSNPWIAGIGNLFSVEFFTEVTRHLQPGGLFVQWIHFYEMDDSTLAIALNTLSSVFPYVSMWHPQGNDVAMVASMEPVAPDTSRMQHDLEERGVFAQLAGPLVRRRVTDALGFLALQVMSPEWFRSLFPGTPPHNRDRRPLLEYRAPRAFFTGSGATVLEHDERRRVRESTALYLTRSGMLDVLDSAELCSLGRMFATQPTKADQPILGSLLRECVARRVTADSLDSLHRAFVDSLVEQTGLVNVLNTRNDWIRRANKDGLSPADWREFHAFELQMLHRSVTVFTTHLDTHTFIAAHTQCVDLFPLESARFERQKEELWEELGFGQ